jgi:hypothetical protein
MSTKWEVRFSKLIELFVGSVGTLHVYLYTFVLETLKLVILQMFEFIISFQSKPFKAESYHFVAVLSILQRKNLLQHRVRVCRSILRIQTIK